MLAVSERIYMLQAPEAMEATNGGGAPDIGAGAVGRALYAGNVLLRRSQCTTTQIELVADQQGAEGSGGSVIQATTCTSAERVEVPADRRRLTLEVRPVAYGGFKHQEALAGCVAVLYMNCCSQVHLILCPHNESGHNRRGQVGFKTMEINTVYTTYMSPTTFLLSLPPFSTCMWAFHFPA
jgi:hypothetical protein